MKHALSSYLVKYIFGTTCKARSKLRILGLLGARARTCYVGRAHLTYDLPRVPSHPPSFLLLSFLFVQFFFWRFILFFICDMFVPSFWLPVFVSMY